MKSVIGVPFCVSEKEREVISDSFVNPLVAVACPADHVAPPLVGDFMIGNQLGEVLLTRGGESRALLSFRGQKGKSGKVEQARPTLAEGSGNLRDAEIVKRKRAGKALVKTDRGIDLLAELFQRIGGAGSEAGKGRSEPSGRRTGGSGRDSDDVRGLRRQAIFQIFFELAIGVDIDGMAAGSERGGSVFAQIETGNRHGI